MSSYKYGRQLKRRHVLAFFAKLPPCLVGIEACASSHHWSRELQALGHTVRLMPPAYVKPYVKRHKNDATDAEAKRAGGSTIYPVSVRRWRPLWLPASLIRRCSGQEGTSRPGSVSSPNRTQAEARTGSAISANAAIAICAVCSLQVHSP